MQHIVKVSIRFPFLLLLLRCQWKALFTYNRYIYIKNQCQTYIIDISLTLTSFVRYFYSNILHRINRIIKYTQKICRNQCLYLEIRK